MTTMMIVTAFVILVVGLAITKPRVDSLESKWVNESNKGVYRGEVKGLRIVSKTLQKDSYDLVAFNVVVVERSAVYVGIFRQFFRLYGKVDIDVEVRVDEDEESNEESAQIRELEHKLSHEGSNKLEFQAQLNDLRQRKKTVDESNVELKNEIKQLSDELYRIGKHNKQSADTQLRLENETNSYTRQMDRYTTDIAANDAYTASVNLEDLDKELLSTTNSVNQLHADISSLSSQYNQLNDQLNASTSPNSPPLEFNLLPSQLLDDYE